MRNGNEFVILVQRILQCGQAILNLERLLVFCRSLPERLDGMVGVSEVVIVMSLGGAVFPAEDGDKFIRGVELVDDLDSVDPFFRGRGVVAGKAVIHVEMIASTAKAQRQRTSPIARKFRVPVELAEGGCCSVGRLGPDRIACDEIALCLS